MVTAAQLSSQPFLTIPEVCRLIRCNSSTIWRWASRGIKGIRLPIHALAGKRVVFEADLNSFLSETAVKKAEPQPALATPSQARQQQIDQANAEAAARGY